MMHNKIVSAIEGVTAKRVTISINPRDNSVLRGQKSAEYKRLTEKYPHIGFFVKTDDKIVRGNFEISIEK